MHSLQGSIMVRLFLALWLAITPTFVWACPMTLCGAGGPAAGGGYTGPGNVAGSTAKFWWGLRAYSTAKAGTKAIKLCDHLGANCTDVSTNASTGALNAPTAIGADNCTSITTCTIDTFYDQANVLCTASVACDVQQTTNANRATFTWNSGAPFAVFNGTTTAYTSPASLLASVATPLTVSMVADLTAAPAGLQQVISDNNGLGNVFTGFSNSAVQSITMYGGNTIPVLATTLNIWQSLQYFLNSPTGAAFEANGTTTGAGSDPGSGPFGTGQIALGASAGNSTRFFGGNFREGGLWAGSPTDMTSNQRAFWGF